MCVRPTVGCLGPELSDDFSFCASVGAIHLLLYTSGLPDADVFCHFYMQYRYVLGTEAVQDPIRGPLRLVLHSGCTVYTSTCR